MPTPTETFLSALRTESGAFDLELTREVIDKLARYYELWEKWNERLHLVAPCSAEEFATRHVLESLMLLRHLSPNARVADIGSGAGLPIIPCLIARGDIRATLFESSARKAVFLREALKVADCQNRADLVTQEFQATQAPSVQFVTCRALDQFERLLPVLIEWAPSTSTLLLFAGENIVTQVQQLLTSVSLAKIPKSARRFLIAARVQPRDDPGGEAAITN